MFRLASSLGLTEPQLPSLVEKPSEGKHWIHEIKHDGYRSLLDECRQSAHDVHHLRRGTSRQVTRLLHLVFQVTDEFVNFVSSWRAETSDFGENSNKGRSPRPKPALRTMPPGSNDPGADRGV